jgi:lipoprotein
MKTKYILGIFAVFCLLLSGCKVGNVASSQGLSDQAFLFFTSTHKYRTPVSVTIDKTTHFDAKVVKEGKHTVKGDTYAVATGKRHVVVSYQGKILFERDVFLSTQETKKIALP